MNELLARLRLRYRYANILLRALVVTDFRLRYQASILGYLWTLLRPLALFTILYLVFVQLLKIGKTIPYNAVYLLLGIVVWGFFGEATVQGLGSIVTRADLMRKISFPRYVVVVSAGTSALISFGINLVVIALFMLIARVPLRLDMLWLPLLVVELVVFSLTLAFFLSAMFVRYRDVSYIWEVVAQGAFYATPILYPPSLLPLRYARLLMLSPMAQIIQDTRYVVVTNQTVTLTQLYGTPWVRAIPVGITIAMAFCSVSFFRRRSPAFAEEV